MGADDGDRGLRTMTPSTQGQRERHRTWVLADRVIGCARCACPAALVGDPIPADGLCADCRGCACGHPWSQHEAHGCVAPGCYTATRRHCTRPRRITAQDVEDARRRVRESPPIPGWDP